MDGHDGAPSPTVVHVVDDDPLVARTVARILGRAGYRVQSYPSAKAFLDGASLTGPSCVVLDVHMPGMTGLELQAELVQVAHPPAIVFLSGADSVGVAVEAMKGGAVDFLAKPFEARALVAAVERAVGAARRRYETRTGTESARALLGRLSPREREVFSLLVQGLRSKEIAGRLGAAVKTVSIHRGRIMDKLEASSVADLVRIAERAGEDPPAR